MGTVGRRGTTDVATAPAGLVLLLDRVADSLLAVTGAGESWGPAWAAPCEEARAGAPAVGRSTPPRPGDVVDLDARRGPRSRVGGVVPAQPAHRDATDRTGHPAVDAATDADLRLRRRAAIEQASRRRARRRLRRLGLRVR